MPDAPNKLLDASIGGPHLVNGPGSLGNPHGDPLVTNVYQTWLLSYINTYIDQYWLNNDNYWQNISNKSQQTIIICLVLSTMHVWNKIRPARLSAAWGLFILIIIWRSIFILISIWILISLHTHPPHAGAVRPRVRGWGDINIHVDINLNIDIHIIINLNIENPIH